MALQQALTPSRLCYSCLASHGIGRGIANPTMCPSCFERSAMIWHQWRCSSVVERRSASGFPGSLRPETISSSGQVDRWWPMASPAEFCKVVWHSFPPNLRCGLHRCCRWLHSLQRRAPRTAWSISTKLRMKSANRGSRRPWDVAALLSAVQNALLYALYHESTTDPFAAHSRPNWCDIRKEASSQ